MWKRRRALGLVLIGALASAACSTASDEGNNDDEIRNVERVIIGKAKPYSPDRTLDAKIDLLTKSQKARREAAWKAIAKVLKDARLAENEVEVDDQRPKLPAFRTWYQKDDVERMFSRLYEGHGKEARRARKAFTSSQLDGVIDWNAGDRGSWVEEQYFERVKQIGTEAQVQGLGGNSRVSYSPGMVRHLLRRYATLTKCARGEIPDDPSAAPASATNFSTCFDEEFPKDAAVVKASWLRADFGLKVPVRPTTPEALKARLDGSKDEGGWGKGATADEQSPDEKSIYTVKMSDGSTFRMPAMHLVTKELREWLWITIWWSPDPDTDFGADRPVEIKRLVGPWKNYKMAVVVAYDEKDPDPTGGYPTGPGSLGDALKATYGGVSPERARPTWTSNQYIERGAHNAQTNCIGCHQHAGTKLLSEDILADARKFPEAGRTKVRKNFPADYVFAAAQPPESIAQMMQSKLEHYDTIDR